MMRCNSLDMVVLGLCIRDYRLSKSAVYAVDKCGRNGALSTRMRILDMVPVMVLLPN